MTGPIRTILAAVDFSASSERAFGYTLAVAKAGGATLHVLHAWRVRCRVVHERPEDAIVNLAEAEGADLITLGVHGHVPLAAALLGSVAERVVCSAPFPVGSVR